MCRKIPLILIVLLVMPAFTILAGEADVLDVKVIQLSSGKYRFDVTVSHNDSGWKHYTNKWEIVDGKGNILATRVLLHPHENEQPFTRSLGNVEIPESVTEVIVRAHDLVHGYGGKTKRVNLTGLSPSGH